MCSLSGEILPPTVSVDTVRSKINDDSLRLIDVRREEEYNQGHIPNAVNLPLASLLSGDSPESAVKLFEETGILAKHEFKGGKARYEELNEGHHDHLIDVKTGEIIEFVDDEIEKLQKKVAEKHGYTLVDHKLELYGVKKKSQ